MNNDPGVAHPDRPETWTDEDKKMYAIEGNTMAFEIKRMRVQNGLTFSAEAFDAFLMSVSKFIGTRVIKFWDENGEPPTVLRVVVATAIDSGDPEKVEPPRNPDVADAALDVADKLLSLMEKMQTADAESKGVHAAFCDEMRSRLTALHEQNK